MNNHISVVIITFNEERNIERCLKSLITISDEIIVIDSNSIDNTQNIANRFDVKFMSQPWQGYSNAKNFGINIAKYPYILSIDADEELDEALIKEIVKMKKQGLKGVYELNRFTNYCGKWIKYSGWYPDKKIRIFPKEIKWNDAIVHEELTLPENIEITSLKGHLLHYSYNSLQEHRIRANKYSILTAKKYFEMKRKTYYFQPLLSAIGRFLSMYFFKLGFLDGISGWHIARISAASNYLKYKELKRLYAQQ